MILARALLDPTTPVFPALKTALSVRTPGDNPSIEQALDWPVRRLPGRELLMRNGLSTGFSSILILEPLDAFFGGVTANRLWP